MNKILFTAIAMMAITSSYAQQQFFAGPKIGLGHAVMNGDDDNIDNKYQPSANIGVTFVYLAESRFGLGADLKYSIEGSRKKNVNSGNVKKTNLNYLRLPIRGIYFFDDFGADFRPNISVGPSVGILVNGKEKIGSVKADVNDRYKLLDLGMLASVGFHYNLMAKTSLQLDMHYYFGGLDVSDAAEANRNRNIGVNVGLVFGFGEAVYHIQ